MNTDPSRHTLFRGFTGVATGATLLATSDAVGESRRCPVMGAFLPT
jgi:hypothetical protein